MAYNPRPFTLMAGLGNLSPELRAVAGYVEEELRTLALSLVETEAVETRTVNVEPSKPREGMIVVADGTDWDPGSGGGPYVYFGGAWVFLAGGGSGIVCSEITVDFTSLASEKFFDATLVGAVVGQKVLATVSLNMPSGVDEDELEMDPITVAGYVTTTDQVRLLVSSVNSSPIYGQRKINVTLIT